MTDQMHFVTLGVRDVDVACRFYTQGFGWEPTFEIPGEICFIQVAPGVLLALWGAVALAADVGVDADDAGHGTGRFGMAHNVGSAKAVERRVAQLKKAGGKVVKKPQKTFFGYHAYVEDPDGFRWEIAFNPGWSVDADGKVHIGDA